MKRSRTTMTLGVLLLAAGPAGAADLVTPPLANGSAARVTCRAVNVHTSSVSVGVQIFEAGSLAAVAVSGGDVPSRAFRTATKEAPTAGATYYCRVSGLSKSKGRVSLCLEDASEMCTEAVFAE